ncbi:MAG: PAS domain-containing sensor histidine kinase [Bacteroidetes bacterium]|nr:PAS domain-containing sensor histidine kinase [Bacteroidota bacterium]
MSTSLKPASQKKQYLVSLLSVSIVAGLSLFTRDWMDYKVTGYLLLVVVSLLAIFLDMKPVLFAAVFSALVLNYLFIKPYYTLHINSTEDFLLLLMFFVIALVNAVLTFKIRKAEELSRVREAKISTMKLYNTLLDSLSHELRTPIATIMGGIGMLQEQSGRITPENKTKLLSEMDKASMRLNHQVENLLNMSRLESGYIQPHYDWCDLSELVYNVLDSLKDDLQFHRVQVKKNDYLPLFKLDYGLTEQILYNLIYNASLYTPKGAAIQILIDYMPEADFEYHSQNPMACQITVADDGPGFQPNEIAHAFDKFYRPENAKTGGTGLGLSIVRGFTEAQNGTISLQNAEDGGAVFTVQFPAAVMHLKDISHE